MAWGAVVGCGWDLCERCERVVGMCESAVVSLDESQHSRSGALNR